MWASHDGYDFERGRLFLGHDGNGKKLGIKTERHALTVAGAGAGKGACVIIPNLLEWPHNALVIDPKGEAANETAEYREREFGQKSYVIDPFNVSKVDPRFKASFNPLAALDPSGASIKEDIAAITDGIVMRGHDTSSAHWDDGAQRVLNGLIGYVLLCLPPEQQTLVEVRAILRNTDRFDTAMEQMKNLRGCGGVCESGASAAYAGEGRYFVSNADKNTDWLDSDAMANALGASSFSLSDLKNGRASVYLVLPANYLGQHGRFLRLFVRCAIEEMARLTPSGDLRGSQCLFILDEFFSLGYIDEIAKSAGLMRGYGLQLWPILQDLGQLLKLYGREGAETFFGNADLHQFFGNTDKLTLEYMSAVSGSMSIDEVGAPPETPHDAPPMGGGMGQSDNTLANIIGSLSASVANSHYSKVQAKHQDRVANYQQKMSQVGRPRLLPEQLAAMVKRKDDVVADLMYVIAYGTDKLWIVPDPYFRRINKDISQNISEKVNEKPADIIDWILAFLYIILGFVALYAGITKFSEINIFLAIFIICGGLFMLPSGIITIKNYAAKLR